jgi:hypothetical protein
MNRALSLPIFTVVVRKFRVGDDADPESVQVAPSAYRGFPFQMNPAWGARLVNEKHPRPQRVSAQSEMALSNSAKISVSIKSIGG